MGYFNAWKADLDYLAKLTAEERAWLRKELAKYHGVAPRAWYGSKEEAREAYARRRRARDDAMTLATYGVREDDAETSDSED